MKSVKLADQQQLLLGDHLWIRKGLYRHHGLYIGPDLAGEGRVVHYAGWVEGCRTGPLCLTSLSEFSEGKVLQVRHYRKRPFTRAQAVSRALSRLNESAYDVHINNCEHLCCWAITGAQRSAQIEWLDTVLGVIHPALEGCSRSYAAYRKPIPKDVVFAKRGWRSVAAHLAMDWGLKSAARYAMGPSGFLAYAGYRLAKQCWHDRRQ